MFECDVLSFSLSHSLTHLHTHTHTHTYRYVNRALEEAAAGEEDDTLSIGVLDIYGFEVFQKNGFEQFCINFVNEKLQQIFIELTLKAEQQEYKREGIKWSKIPYFDNKTVCDLIEGKRPAGVFVILDDTCKTMHAESSGVDMKFLQKLNTYQSKHKHYIGRSKVFTIKHYAGDVDYSAEGFCVANKDILLDDLAECLASSQSDIIASFAPSSKKKNSTAGMLLFIPPLFYYLIFTSTHTQHTFTQIHHTQVVRSRDKQVNW